LLLTVNIIHRRERGRKRQIFAFEKFLNEVLKSASPRNWY